jgi:hypothetical protein
VFPLLPPFKPLRRCLSVGSVSSLAAGVKDIKPAKTIRNVSFNQIEICEQPRTLGDRPAASSGQALTLDWYVEGDGNDSDGRGSGITNDSRTIQVPIDEESNIKP